MILVIGGEGAGKRTFVRTLGYTDGQMSDGYQTQVVFHAERLVQTQDDVPQAFEQLRGKAVVIMNEVGAGVIPADRAQTLAREAAGRLGVLLAKEASCVVRVICGIPTIIKGSL